MQKKLQKYIDLLIEMAGSENDYETIKEELNEIDKEIDFKKTELKNIKKSMKDDKYIKENDRIIDENIKIGLENKKQVYQYELDKTLKLINKASVDEEDNHQALTSVVSRLKSLNALVDVLQDKLKVVGKDKNLNTFYENMIEEVTKEISELEKKKEILTKQYDKVRERLEYYGNNRSELDKKIEHLNVRLEDTLEALSTPNFYVDELLKKKDESAADELISELEELEKNRLSLITDPTYIGKEAMKMYMEEDYTSTLASIKELVTIVKSKPYMNENKKNLNNILKQAEITLDEFANNMDNNTYLGDDVKIIDNRIEYLEQELKSLSEMINVIKDKIVEIDRNVVIKISEKLSETEDLYNKLKDDYEEYKKIVLVDDDSLSPRKKANLQAAYNQKKEEMDLVYQIFENYQSELEKTIMTSQKLETVDLVNLEKRQEDISEEISELKKSKGTKKAKDVLAMEKDKATLNQLSLDVDNIKHSQKYDKTVDEIYSEIENLFNDNAKSDEVEQEEKTPILNKDEFVNLNEFKIDNDLTEVPSYDTNPIENNNEEESNQNDSSDISSLSSEFKLYEEPVVSNETPSNNEEVVKPLDDNSLSGEFKLYEEPVVPNETPSNNEEVVKPLDDNSLSNEFKVYEQPEVQNEIPVNNENTTSLDIDALSNEFNTYEEPQEVPNKIPINNEDTTSLDIDALSKEFKIYDEPSENNDVTFKNEPIVAPLYENNIEPPVINPTPINFPSDNVEQVVDSSFKPDDKILQTADENLEDTKVFPPRNRTIPSEERHKVINIEALPSKEPKKENQPEVLAQPVESLEEPFPTLNTETLTEPVNEQPKENDYISFNDILNGGYNGN